MTVGVMASCSPAQWGMPRNGLCRARTGAPHGGNPNPPPQTQGPQGHVEYWKAQCGESRTLRLGGGKGRKPLPICTIIGTEKWVKLYIGFSGWTMRNTKEAFHRSARQ
jgi:hypothetical protein